MAGRLSSPTFVGRRGEFAVLRAALERALGREPGLVLVGGDAGVGKTRLVGELTALAAERGARTLVGACLDVGDEGLPYGPFLQALRDLSRAVPSAELEEMLGPGREMIVRLVPGLGRLLDPEGLLARDADPAGEGAAEQARLFELSLAIVERVATGTGLVLVIEDLHWADTASRDLLLFLARNLRHERVLLVATYRADAVGPGARLRSWLAELARDSRVVRVELLPLARDEQLEQLTSILGHEPPAALAGRIIELAAGNPFFAEELLAAADDGAPDDASPTLPRTIRDLLVARIGDISPAARQVLAAGAIAGRPVDDHLLGVVTGLDDDRLGEAIREALSHQIIELGTDSGAYRFRHPLLAETVATDLLSGERRRLHVRFAEILQRHPALGEVGQAGAAAEIARHWSAAGRDEDALTASIDAGLAAIHSFAGRDALRQFERALELWDRLGGPPAGSSIDRAELHARASEAAELAGEAERAIEHARAGIALVDPAADPAGAALLRTRLGFALWATGESHASVVSHREAVELLPANPPTVARARALGALAGALMGIGQFRESRDWCEASLEAGRAAGAFAETGRALNVLGCDLVGLGEVDDGLDRLTEALEIAKVHGPPDALLGAHHNLSFLLAQTDHLEDGLRVAREGIDAAVRIGLHRRFGAGLRATAGDVLYRLGRWSEAEEVTSAGLELDPDASGRIYLHVIRSLVMTGRGALDAATAQMTEVERLASGDIDPDLAAYVAAARAELALSQGDPHAALAAVRGGIERLAGSDEILLVGLLTVQGLVASADLAEAARAWRAGRDLETARAAASEYRDQIRGLEPRLAGDGLAAAPPSFVARLATAEAEWSRAEGYSDPTAWLAAADAWERVGMPYPAARARMRAAETILLARGPRDTAADLLRLAHATAESLGARQLVDACVALARRSRMELEVKPAALSPEIAASPIPRSPAQVLGLSAREWQVLELVAAGRSNGQIAETLFISPKTASVHVTHILDKLGVSNRVEAAAIAVRMGAGIAPAET